MRSDVLQLRADLLSRVRRFFVEREFVEVETPLVADEIIPELHIEPVAVEGGRWLQASPEMFMKRLLCDGATSIFQITRSFRKGERGRLHNPEFTIVEWYRTGDDMQSGMMLLDELCQHVADAPPATQTSYAEAFERRLGIDPHTADCDELASQASKLPLAPPDFERADRDEWLNFLLASHVEQHLGREAPEIVYDFPSTQASLAKLEPTPDGVQVARRFELYWQGIELANGYDELIDAAELRERLVQVNRQRVADRRAALPMPESLLADMRDRGLPACAGCALGFDRLAMLACGASSIHEVLARPS